MGKIDEYASGRNDGLQLALKIVEEDGVDALREEIKFQNPTAIDVNAKSWELKVVKPCRIGPRNRSMTELLFCMLRSGR